MTETERETHTPECKDLTGTIQSLDEHEREIIFSCPHWAHDIPKQFFHR